MNKFVDGLGQPLRVSGGDRVTVLGWDYQFETVSIRPEGVAVIRNLSIEAVGTSSVPLRQLTRCRFEAEYHPHAGECGPAPAQDGTPTPKRITSRNVDCPTCGAPKGERCRGSAYSGRGGRTVDYHMARRAIARKASGTDLRVRVDENGRVV